jgi:autotransporter passenger strand-loop-strand repeat protein
MPGTLITGGDTQYVGEGSADTVTGTVVDSGTQQVGGSVTYDYYYGGVVSETVNLSGGGVSDTTVNSGGFEIVSSGGTASNMTVNSGGLLQVVSGGSTVSSITGTDLVSGGTINLAYATYATGATAVLNSSTDVLTVTDGANDYTLQMGGTYASGVVFDVSSATTGLDITEALCYLHGTRVLTPYRGGSNRGYSYRRYVDHAFWCDPAGQVGWPPKL